MKIDKRANKKDKMFIHWSKSYHIKCFCWEKWVNIMFFKPYMATKNSYLIFISLTDIYDFTLLLIWSDNPRGSQTFSTKNDSIHPPSIHLLNTYPGLSQRGFLIFDLKYGQIFINSSLSYKAREGSNG